MAKANDTKPEWNVYRFDTPQKIIAGFAGDEEVFFDCCDCRKEDAVMHGCLALSMTREDVAIVSKPDGSDARPAYYCEACFNKALTEGN